MPASYRVTTKKTPSQPAGLTKVFVQNSTPNVDQIRKWLKEEYKISSGASSGDFIIEKL